MSHRTDVCSRARQYVQGLLQADDRKNCERMAEIVPESDDQALQQFLSDSKWSAQAVMDALSLRASHTLGGK